jgi:hypothetical protein
LAKPPYQAKNTNPTALSISIHIDSMLSNENVHLNITSTLENNKDDPNTIYYCNYCNTRLLGYVDVDVVDGLQEYMTINP